MFGQSKCRLNNLQTAFPYPQAQPYHDYNSMDNALPFASKPRIAADGVQMRPNLAGVTAIPRYPCNLIV